MDVISFAGIFDVTLGDDDKGDRITHAVVEPSTVTALDPSPITVVPSVVAVIPSVVTVVPSAVNVDKSVVTVDTSASVGTEDPEVNLFRLKSLLALPCSFFFLLLSLFLL